MNTSDTKAPASAPAERRDKRGARHRARLAVVQALYQMDQTGTPVTAVVGEFIAHRFPAQDRRIDDGFFADLAHSVVEHQVAVDRRLARFLMESWELDRLDSTLRALLRAATCELLFRLDVPARVVLNEYIEIAHSFFAGQESGFANGVLNQIARGARPEEFASDANAGHA